MSRGDYIIARCSDLPDLSALLEASLAEGHQLIHRTIDDYVSGKNRFDLAGEALFSAQTAGGRIIGVCGLNIDPYEDDPTVGRVRHLYVLPDYRRRGVGRRLIMAVITAASPIFRRLQLRTNSVLADAFYRQAGFSQVDGHASVTHWLDLTSDILPKTSANPRD